MNRKIAVVLLALILTPVLFSFKIQEQEKRFRISAIWVKTETAAQEILQKLIKGEKFADLVIV